MSELIKFGRNGQLQGEEEAVKCGTMVREFHFRLRVGTLNTDIGINRRLHSQDDKPSSKTLFFLLCYKNRTVSVSGDVYSHFLS